MNPSPPARIILSTVWRKTCIQDCTVQRINWPVMEYSFVTHKSSQCFYGFWRLLKRSTADRKMGTVKNKNKTKKGNRRIEVAALINSKTSNLIKCAVESKKLQVRTVWSKWTKWTENSLSCSPHWWTVNIPIKTFIPTCTNKLLKNKGRKLVVKLKSNMEIGMFYDILTTVKRWPFLPSTQE